MLNQSNDGVDGVDYSDNTSFGGGSVTFTGATPDAAFFTSENTNVACFAAGTRIASPNGWRKVERLCPGDLVMTADDGPVPVLFVRSSLHHWGRRPHKNKPIVIGKNRLGQSLPLRDLIVSPQHRMLLRDPASGAEWLAPSKALTVLPGVRQMKGLRETRYFHVALDRHSVLNAEGIAAESLFPGRHVLPTLSLSERTALRPYLLRDASGMSPRVFKPARRFVTVRAARQRLTAGAVAAEWHCPDDVHTTSGLIRQA